MSRPLFHKCTYQMWNPLLAGDLILKMSADQRACLANGPVFRAHHLKTELLPASALQARAGRFYASMQAVTPPSPAILIPLYVLLCQQMTLLVKSLDKGSARTSTGVVFQARLLFHAWFCTTALLIQLSMPSLRKSPGSAPSCRRCSSCGRARHGKCKRGPGMPVDAPALASERVAAVSIVAPACL
jgi:hypothetical protein